MNNYDPRSKLENIIRGVSIEGATDSCTTTRNLLCRSFSTSTTVKRDFESKSVIKEEQAAFLKKYAWENSLWYDEAPPSEKFLARGGEACVYFEVDSKSVIKLNDGIYYATWLEFNYSPITVLKTEKEMAFPLTTTITKNWVSSWKTSMMRM
jgi:hypothetical protein